MSRAPSDQASQTSGDLERYVYAYPAKKAVIAIRAEGAGMHTPRSALLTPVALLSGVNSTLRGMGRLIR
jgi:hypothetical protein